MYLAEVKLGPLGPVLIPIHSQRELQSRRSEILSQANEFYIKGRFIEQCTNRRFLKLLAQDFSRSLTPIVLNHAAAAFAKAALSRYTAILENTLESNGPEILKNRHSFLRETRPKTTARGVVRRLILLLPDEYGELLYSRA